MSCYYIDYENLHSAGFDGLCLLDHNDVVIVYYSKDAQTITIELHIELCNSKATVKYVKISDAIKGSAKNALDIRLMNDLEETMKKNKSAEYFIVSNDTDYDKFVTEWEKKQYKIKKISKIGDKEKLVPEKKQANNNASAKVEKQKKRVADTKQKNNNISKIDNEHKKYKERRHELVEELLSNAGYSDKNREFILDALDRNYGQYQEMFNMLDKKYGEEERKRIWQVIKSAF